MIEIVEYISYAMMPILIITIIVFALKNKISIYETFIEGSKESFSIILDIFPSMLAILLVINLLKISGGMELVIKFISPFFMLFKVPPEVVPIGVMRSISGGGALGFLTDILKNDGPDSFIGRVASTIMGSSDTTLYVLAIYTAAIGVSKGKFALVVGLICDVLAFLMAVWLWQ